MKVKKESSSSDQNNWFEQTFLFLLILFLPVQLGKHFWPDFSFLLGIRVDYLSPTLYITDIFAGLLFISWLVKKIKNKQFNRPSLPGYIFLCIFLYFFLTVIISEHLLNGLYHLLKFLEFVFISYYVTLYISTEKRFETIVTYLSCGVIFSSILAVCQFINQGSIGSFLYYLGERSFSSQTPGIANASVDGQLILRPYATFPHPNVLAGFLLTVIILVFFQISQQKTKIKQLIYVGTLLLGTSALLLTMSRIALMVWFIILLGTAVVIGYRAFIMKRKRVKVLTIFFVSSAILVIGIFISPVGSRIMQTSLTEESVVQRKLLIDSSIKIWQQHPLVGTGLGNFLAALSAISQPLSLTQYLQPVHNIYLLIAVETGVIGLVIFLLVIGITYRHLFFLVKKNNMYISLLFVFSAVLLIGFFDHYFLTLQQGQLLFAIIVGLCWARFNV